MTRTERAAYPRAINRDRSESRTGLDSSLRKRGAGGHNWGSLDDEQFLEASAMDDESLELEAEETNVGAKSQDLHSPLLESPAASPKPPVERSSSVSSAASNSPTEEERERARQLRKNAFKKGDQLDLSAIARTSAGVSTSPPQLEQLTRRPGQDNRQITVD